MNKIKDQIISMLFEHSRIIFSIISDMGVFYLSLVEKSYDDEENLEKKKNKMQLDVEDGTLIKNEAIKIFSEAIDAGLGDYMTLFLKMENLSYIALKFVDLLAYIPLKDLNSDIKHRYHKTINIILEMVDLLRKTIILLRDNTINVIHNINNMYERGNSVEKIFRDFLNHIYDNKEDLSIRNLLIIRDSIIALEQLVEKILHIVEIIRILHYQ